MYQMTNLLEEVIKKGNLNRATRRVDCYQALNQCDVRGENVLYVTGHSRYLDSNDTIRAISDRTLGGFALDAVAELCFNAICAGIQDIELWCCETACKKGTEELKATDATTAKQTLNLDALYQLKTAVENKAATSSKHVGLHLLQADPTLLETRENSQQVGPPQRQIPLQDHCVESCRELRARG